ncbi:MAG: DNA polymerase III subunit delta [Acidimicrobiia bacterium]|nr:DNA polymerase III subunit delta [Acidimicrobiia bacterium]
MMTADQFVRSLEKGPVSPVYLFLGPESYAREACRSALLKRVLGDGEREESFIRHDMEEVPLAAVVDDARSLSLFAPKRVIWASRAEAALPRGRRGSSEGEEDDKGGGDSGALETYLGDPTPDVVVVLDSSRYEFDGEDKSKQDRVKKFYSGIRAVVEFPRFREADAARLARELARARKLEIGSAELDLLVEATGSSAAAIATEIEKLALYAGAGGRVTAEDIAQMVPQARATTIFALVAALGRKDRTQALEILDTLVREGEYLPLALQFLAAQFRQALVAGEAGLSGGRQIMGYFQRMGVAMWPSRAEQIAQTVTAFRKDDLRSALRRISETDVALRDIRPDDRTVMEEFVLGLTADRSGGRPAGRAARG